MDENVVQSGEEQYAEGLRDGTTFTDDELRALRACYMGDHIDAVHLSSASVKIDKQLGIED